MGKLRLGLSLFIVVLIILSLYFAYGVFTKTEYNGNEEGAHVRENKPPVAILSVSSTEIMVGESATFFGGESYDIDGWISGYIFSFGDGSESGLVSEQSIVHSYEEPGNYSAKLMVIDDRNQKSFWSESIKVRVSEPVNMPPVAKLYVKERVRTHENILFDASESYDPDGKISSYVYDFGDGNSTGGTYNKTVYYSYENPGEYNVSLYVIDEKGLASIPVYRVINVTDMPPPEPQAPIAVLRLSATTISVNGTIEFDASNSFDPDGYIVKYFFRVTQDIEISTTECKITYKYTKPGRYYSLLRVEDNDGLQSAWTKEIEINVRTDGIDLAEKFVLLVEEPKNESEKIFVTSISTIAVHNGYHPFFIIDNDALDEQQLATLGYMNVTDDWTVYLFSMNQDTIFKVMEHGFNVKVLPPTVSTLDHINGFSGNISVGSFEESLWAAPVAASEGKIVIEGKKTFLSQDKAWDRLYENGIKANYIVVANPNDNTSLPEEEKYHIPSLSLVAGELAAYHRAYVLTSAPTSTEQIGQLSLLDTTLNARAIGIYSKIKYINTTYGPTKYLALVGSAVAVPQFLFNFDNEGDGHVSSDSAYGFIDSNMSTMDISVGRIINYNVQGATNMLARTFGYSLIEPNIPVYFTRTGEQVVNWKTRGAAISGMQITYQRHQATPCLFLCEDYIDEGYNYTYMGPSSMTLGQETIVPSVEPDAKPIFQSSAFVGYRGHGTSDSSAIGIGIYGSPYGTLYARDFRNFTIPPQVGMFAACENGKIYGLDYGGLSVSTKEMFAPNYM
ncbi:MAG: PKD domain-containing protein, partial [Thermoplasmata archaeon]